mgnify:CR=1 FL=1
MSQKIINPRKLRELPAIGQKISKTTQKPKPERKRVTYMFESSTAELVRRVAYWERFSSGSKLVENAIIAYTKGMKNEPIPEDK